MLSLKMVLYAKTCSKQNKVVVILQTMFSLLAYGNSLINKIIAAFYPGHSVVF